MNIHNRTAFFQLLYAAALLATYMQSISVLYRANNQQTNSKAEVCGVVLMRNNNIIKTTRGNSK